MILQQGLPLLYQQFTALFKKNLLLSWRNKRSTCLQLFSSFFFILVIFCIEEAMKASEASSSAYKNVTDPTLLFSPPILPCEDKFFVKLPCYDFVWSGNNSRRVTEIVSAIMANNPGRPIPTNKVQSFKGPEEVDAWFMSHPLQVPGALHFVERNATVISYGVQTNSSSEEKRGRIEDPTFKFLVPLQIAAEREIARSLIGDPKFGWGFGFKEFARPAIIGKTISALKVMGPIFFLAFSMFGFVLQLGSLVTEKELKLRQAMTMMGVFDTAYWLSWLIWEGLLTFVSSLFLVLFGMMFQFDFFLKKSFFVVFLLFLLFQFNMISLAFVLSSFISKSSSATTVGFLVFLISFILQIVSATGFPYSSAYSASRRAIWSLFPPNTFSAGLKLLLDATSTPESSGISWSERAVCEGGMSTCVISVDIIYQWQVGSFLFWFVLAMYFDNIIPNASGVRKPIFYFLTPGYWTGKGGNKMEVPPVEHVASEDQDVLEEETLVKQQAMDGIVDPNIAVQIHGLAKTYPGTTKLGCCKCTKTSPFHAVKGLWMNIAKDQLFCMLGPNGAGKTTSISCLTGINPITGGDALIYGDSVRSSVGMSNIRKMIGVCPQFDILWDALSSEEHLHLFASIKGLPPPLINSTAEKLLADVKLTGAAKVRAGSYSGGMKRRLSVAVALIGDPKLVFLDEPTTGMDPITRRHVWDIIQESKKGRAIILTTHSMEEADILSDRIGIMAKGRLRCIGTSIRLKSRFGTGFVATVSFTESKKDNSNASGDSHEPVKRFFNEHLKVEPADENKAFMTFVIPHDKEKLLTVFFEELENRESEFGISDIQLGLATLEEVFLNIARRAELENATTEGITVTLDLVSGISLEIPVGARFVGIPDTESAENPSGVMVEVYWQQDGSGSTCITGHSSEMRIPQNVLVTRLPSPNALGHKGLRQAVRGIVIDL
ncbi:PREDICTED: ABC transporter A family member 11 isoform X2 [Brassica oleracea var. oleracea]|uniref:ABC transporter A family member 11 isoform X2 n=1 Tax=Brassica oleracea var. oleracea TaxID=109376 RepID=UPI0006A6D6E3|nr:PREDICTED: ABC transporter A family member 11 isoform X2 [Brassica oleracea var. oleracea]